MALVSEVLESVRSHLRDEEATLWTDPKLFPKLKEAHRELQLKLKLNGVPVLTAVTTILTVPALVTDLTTVTGYPTNLVEPIWLRERKVGQSASDFVDVAESDFIPNIKQDLTLSFWAWIGEKIITLGSTGITEIQLRYRRGLTIPATVNDSVGVLFGELYLSYRTAALCLSGERAMELNSYAQSHLVTIVAAAAKEAQNLPARRRGYHRNNNTWT